MRPLLLLWPAGGKRAPSTCHPLHVSQYALGLECLHEDLPQIKCELEFKNRRLQLRPALEEVLISAIYLGDLTRRFIRLIMFVCRCAPSSTAR